MDSGFETSNDSTDSSADLTKILQKEFRNLIEKNATRDFNYSQQSTSYSDAATQKQNHHHPPQHHSWKMKSRLNTANRSHHCNDFDDILNSSKKKRLAVASMTNNVELVNELLRSRKVDPNAADCYARTPLHLAASRGYTDIVKTLIYYGANPNLKDSLGNTPLHLAACTCKKPVIVALLDGGANVNITDSNNRTPFDLAISKYKLRSKFETTKIDINRLEEVFEMYSLLHPDSKNNANKSEDDIKMLLENLTLNE